MVGGSWYAACFFARRYAFLNRQLGSENFGRFFGTLGAMPAWYYVKPLLFNSGPLSLLILFAVFFALRSYRQSPAEPALDRASDVAAHALDSGALNAARLFAIFWVVSVGFFSLAAYKRRSYLLPLWPSSAVMLVWCAEMLYAKNRLWGRWFCGLVILSCCGSIAFNAVYLPRRKMWECAGDSVRDGAHEINRIVGSDEPLYLYGFGEDPAPLLFYLDRGAPPVNGKLGDAPPGYVIIPVEVWRQHRQEGLDLTPVFQSSSGRPPVILLRRGKLSPPPLIRLDSDHRISDGYLVPPVNADDAFGLLHGTRGYDTFFCRSPAVLSFARHITISASDSQFFSRIFCST